MTGSTSPPNVSLRQRLREGPPLIGTFSIIAAPEIIEIAGLAGFDVVVLDMEHGAYEIASLGPHILAARAHGIAPIVRVRWSEPALIGAAPHARAAGGPLPPGESPPGGA